MAPTWIPCAVVMAVAGAGGLAMTNPGPSEFQAFAGQRLADAISREICLGNTLPLALHLVLQHCPDLVAAQQPVLGRIALQNTRRTNLGLLSIYRTELGGTTLLGWSLPRFSATVVAAAGQLVIVRACLDEEGS